MELIMKNNKALLLIGLMLLTPACSRDYTPKPSETAEQIFQAACAECHAAENPDAPNMIFTLDSNNANSTYIAHKVHSGSFMMPKFPNIKGKKMSRLSDYVLDHSLRD
jgi:mono/diheme cytochrome c family protein